MDRVREALTEYWGPQCSDFDPDCFCCQAWAELDELTGAARQLADWAEHEVGCDLDLTPGLAELRRLL